MISKHEAAQFECRNSSGFGLHEHSANKNEQWQFETARYSPELLPFLTIGQGTLPQPNANLQLDSRANHNTDATIRQSSGFLKTLHQLGLAHSPNQTLVDWICGVP